jgi:formiminotetrahydrofolate cyclodeaminase
MENNDRKGRTRSGIADLSARVFNQRIADPDVFCGGGSVAALAAAGAGATALLVMRLSLRRKRNAGLADEIRRDIERTERIIERCYAAADDDIARLDELLLAQRAAKTTGDRARYVTALEAAAESPIAMSEEISQLLDVVAAQLPIATRFTASDLGAAASIAEGAVRGALLTADVNIELLRDAAGSSTEAVDALQRRRDAVLQHVLSEAANVERATRRMIAGETKSEGSA